MKTQERNAAFATLLFVFLSSGPLCALSEAQKEARRILQAGGFKGGLIVHLGCKNGELTAALYKGPGSLVHGLALNAADLQKARKTIRSAGCYGPVSADLLSGGSLPYADNLVNLLVADSAAPVSEAELLRVLAPGGVLLLRRDGRWEKRTKSPSAKADEWTHYLHAPDNNPVSRDEVVGPPRHFQWIAGPRFSRSHDHLASVSVVVSAGGRIFSIVDEGPIAFVAAKPRWRLVARDAFNGIRLWDRVVDPWEYHLRDFRSGPPDLARRLVAVGDRVYVTLGYGKPVSLLDAVTGRTLKIYKGTEGTQEIIFENGWLFLILGERDTAWPAQEAQKIVEQPGYKPAFRHYTPPVYKRKLVVLDAETAGTLWTYRPPENEEIMPTTLAVAQGRVYLETSDAIVCLDRETGGLLWRFERRVQRKRLAWSTPTLVVHQGVVFSADRKAQDTEGRLLWIPSGGYHKYIRPPGIEGELIALDAASGTKLWSCPAYEGFNSPVDVLVADGLVWTGRFAWGKDPGITAARDPRTGRVVRTRPPDQTVIGRIGHSRCHRIRATARYILMGRRGVEFIDVKTGEMTANRWVRGICQYGVLPANGLLYVPPHSCACSIYDLPKCGFLALAPGGDEYEALKPSGDDALQCGPAYNWSAGDSSEQQEAWPTYRHDPERSGSVGISLEPSLKLAWQAELGGKLTAPVISGGTVLVASKDTYTLFALDSKTGRVRWTYTSSSRIDSPPTVWKGRVLFGSRAGYVTCLRLSDGGLAWRFRAAPRTRMIVVDGRLESAWPVPGSTLVLEGSVYFVAGRTSYLDGGMFLYKLSAATGKVVAARRLFVPRKKRDSGSTGIGNLPDVLSAKNGSIFLRHARFDLDLEPIGKPAVHLWSSVGFLDDAWWHRTYWQVGTFMWSGWGAWPRAGLLVPSGRLLVLQGNDVYGYGRNQYDIPGAHIGVDSETAWGPVHKRGTRFTYYRLFRKTIQGTRPFKERGRRSFLPKAQTVWERMVPVLVRAIVAANGTLFIAGPTDHLARIPRTPEEVDQFAKALEAVKGGLLLALDPSDGKTLARWELPSPPVFDGMAAAYGRLYLATKAGAVLCYRPKG